MRRFLSINLHDLLAERIFQHRKLILLLFVLLTVFFGYSAAQIHITTGFQKHVPLRHPFMETFLKYQQDFGGADRLLVAVRAKKGDIFTAHFFDVLKAVTEEVFLLPGIDRSTVRSIFTPNVRYVEVVEGGFAGGNVIPADFRATDDGLTRVRDNILKSGVVGRLVANDFTAAMISAELVETDPRTGERLDYRRVAADLERNIRRKFARGNVDIHIIGFAKLVGDLADGAAGVMVFCAGALAVTAVLLFLFTHSIILTVLVLICSSLAVVWNLGVLALFGFGLDPLWLLVPFLIFAIGVSHGIQMINAFGSAIYNGASSFNAAQSAFRRLFNPGVVALGTDAIGFVTILLIDIGIVRELAITASLGVMMILATNLILLPVLVSFVRLHGSYGERLSRSAARKVVLWKLLARSTEPRTTSILLLSAAVFLAIAVFEARNVKFGDVHIGVPELRPNSRYNRDAGIISEKFSIGVDLLTVFVEAPAESCVDYSVMIGIDRLQWSVANVAGVRSTLSLPQVAKVLHEGWYEGHLKWRVLPRDARVLGQAIAPIETSSGLLNHNCSVMPVLVFLANHKADTIDRVIGSVESFVSKNPATHYTVRLAGGNAGIMAATNDVIRGAQVPMLLWVYGAVIALCWLTFRSWRDTCCVVVPLALVSVFSYALMSLLQIGLRPSTLPVAALGVAIGVDYGIYILSELKRHWSDGIKLQEALLQTLRITGNAVQITGLTLAAGVGTWCFSALKFQADMGLLLVFMFIANMLGALLLLPALAAVFYGVTSSNSRSAHGRG